MKIKIEDLGEGVHHLQLDETPESLTLPTDEGTFAKPFHVDVTITKTDNSLVLQAEVSTKAIFPCSRCLMEYDQHLTAQVDVLYENSGHTLSDTDDNEEDEDIEILDYDAKEIDIGRRVEEALCLAMPLKPLCHEACKGLCPVCGIDLNHTTCNCRTEFDDPRWQGLKEMFK